MTRHDIDLETKSLYDTIWNDFLVRSDTFYGPLTTVAHTDDASRKAANMLLSIDKHADQAVTPFDTASFQNSLVDTPLPLSNCSPSQDTLNNSNTNFGQHITHPRAINAASPNHYLNRCVKFFGRYNRELSGGNVSFQPSGYIDNYALRDLKLLEDVPNNTTMKIYQDFELTGVLRYEHEMFYHYPSSMLDLGPKFDDEEDNFDSDTYMDFESLGLPRHEPSIHTESAIHAIFSDSSDYEGDDQDRGRRMNEPAVLKETTANARNLLQNAICEEQKAEPAQKSSSLTKSILNDDGSKTYEFTLEYNSPPRRRICKRRQSSSVRLSQSSTSRRKSSRANVVKSPEAD